MPSFTVTRKAFELISSGQKTALLRDGTAKEGGEATIMCEGCSLKREIVSTEEGSLTEVLRENNYLMIYPTASSLEQAYEYVLSLASYFDFTGANNEQRGGIGAQPDFK